MTPESHSQPAAPAAKEDERKKGAAPIAGGGGSGSSFSLEQLESLQNTLLQAGGSSVAAPAGQSVVAALVSKIGMLIVVTMLGAGAMNMAKKPAPVLNRPRAKAEKIKYSGDLSNLPSRPEAQDAVQGVVLGDLTRKGDADEAAASASAGDAAKDSRLNGADEAAKAAAAATPSASATPAMAAGDLTAKANKLLGAKKGPFDKKFGALSTSLPGGSTAGGSSALASNGPGFNPNAVKAGASKGLGANAPAKTAANTKAIGAGVRGSAAKQVMNANTQSRLGAAQATADGASQAASGAFDNNRGGGSAITGGGAAITGGGATMGATDTKPNPGGNPISDGTGKADGTQAPPDAGHSNATPWQTFSDIAMYAMMAAIVLMVLAYILAQAAKKSAGYGAELMIAAQVCSGLAMACGAIAALCGVAVLAMGQTMQGGMYALGGAVVTYLAYKQLSNEIDESSKAAKTMVSGPDPETNTMMQNQLGGTHMNLNTYGQQLNVARLC